jgi:hypothetical protein
MKLDAYIESFAGVAVREALATREDGEIVNPLPSKEP